MGTGGQAADSPPDEPDPPPLPGLTEPPALAPDDVEVPLPLPVVPVLVPVAGFVEELVSVELPARESVR